MKTVQVEIPQELEKSFTNKMTLLSFIQTVEGLQESQWIDTKLETPMKMTDFYNVLKKEL